MLHVCCRKDFCLWVVFLQAFNKPVSAFLKKVYRDTTAFVSIHIFEFFYTKKCGFYLYSSSSYWAEFFKFLSLFCQRTQNFFLEACLCFGDKNKAYNQRNWRVLKF